MPRLLRSRKRGAAVAGCDGEAGPAARRRRRDERRGDACPEPGGEDPPEQADPPAPAPAPAPAGPRPAFDASDARHVALAKMALSPAAPAAPAAAGSGVRSAEAAAVAGAVRAMHEAGAAAGAGKCYVCGLPGTGKTHTVTLVAEELARGANMQVVAINCMHLAGRGRPCCLLRWQPWA